MHWKYEHTFVSNCLATAQETKSADETLLHPSIDQGFEGSC